MYYIHLVKYSLYDRNVGNEAWQNKVIHSSLTETDRFEKSRVLSEKNENYATMFGILEVIRRIKNFANQRNFLIEFPPSVAVEKKELVFSVNGRRNYFNPTTISVPSTNPTFLQPAGQTILT